MSSSMSSRTESPIRPARSFIIYQILCWGVLALLGWNAIPAVPALGVALVLGVAAYTTLPLFSFLSRGGGWRRYPTAFFRLAVVRPVLYGQILLPFVTAGALLGLVVGAVAGHGFITARIVAIVTLLACATVLLMGWFGSRALVIREVVAHVPGLPKSFDGLRIAQVSDTHMGPQTSTCFMHNVTRVLHTLQPDVVTVTGDLVDDRAEDVDVFANWLSTITNPNANGHKPFAGERIDDRGTQRRAACHCRYRRSGREAQRLARQSRARHSARAVTCSVGCAGGGVCAQSCTLASAR